MTPMRFAGLILASLVITMTNGASSAFVASERLFGIGSDFPIPLPLRSIHGQTVSAKSGQHVSGVNVSLSGNGITQSQRSDSNGMFQFDGLPPGTYSIRAEGGMLKRVSVGGFDVFVTLEVK